ncbi:hypothetical protein B0J18DRAFT_203547 [Chaetomium sp. MPI-SDFR-AT-0129]|nr:hypothetical protein B0J18DRAFT_203547 [Chaetomium sp. MPI-SDFR-AT-0129]
MVGLGSDITRIHTYIPSMVMGGVSVDKPCLFFFPFLPLFLLLCLCGFCCEQVVDLGGGNARDCLMGWMGLYGCWFLDGVSLIHAVGGWDMPLAVWGSEVRIR